MGWGRQSSDGGMERPAGPSIVVEERASKVKKEASSETDSTDAEDAGDVDADAAAAGVALPDAEEAPSVCQTNEQTKNVSPTAKTR